MKAPTRSKTLVVNVTIVALATWFRFSAFYVDPYLFVLAIATVNIGLRCVTREAIGRARS